jgi:single-strand DNA-binding protein
MSFNKVMILGYLGQDPEIRYTPAGMPVVNFSVATNEAYVDKEGQRHQRTEWHRIVVAGRLALACHNHLKKGRQIFAEGRLYTRDWESNGQVSRRTEIVASRVQFLGALLVDGKADEPAVDASVAAESNLPF